jgi:hypothetical protein
MYFIKLYYKNALQNQSGNFEVETTNRSILKWTILSSKRKQLELLRLIALSTANPQFTPHLAYPFDRLINNLTASLHLESIIFHHPETEGRSLHNHRFVGSGMEIRKDGKIHRLHKRECECLPSDGIYSRIRKSNQPARRFFLAYGPRFGPHEGSDDFDFTNPCYPLTRLHTLFQAYQKITDPIEFLKRMQHKGINYKKYASLSIMTALSTMLKTYLKIDTTAFHEPFADLEQAWRKLNPWQQRMILPLIDICRHLYDAFPKVTNPLDMPGVIIFHRPDFFCPDEWFSSWISLVDSLVPNMQFVISLPATAAHRFPKT